MGREVLRFAQVVIALKVRRHFQCVNSVLYHCTFWLSRLKRQIGHTRSRVRPWIGTGHDPGPVPPCHRRRALPSSSAWRDARAATGRCGPTGEALAGPAPPSGPQCAASHCLLLRPVVMRKFRSRAAFQRTLAQYQLSSKTWVLVPATGSNVRMRSSIIYLDKHMLGGIR